MLDQDDLKWIANTSTELNSMLQQISRYADLAMQHKGEYSYVETLGERVELAAKNAQAIFDCVTSKILARSSCNDPAPLRVEVPAIASRPPSFMVVPPPTAPTVREMKPKTPAATKSAAPAKERSEAGPMTEAAPGAIPPDIPVVNPKGSRELILIVDDEPEIANFASQMLADEGYKVIIARDGFEALRVYQQIGKRIGLIILDFFLPVMDGDAVFDEFRALNPKVNVVLSSGFAEQGKLSNMLAQGLRGFIPKPYSREKLLEQVRSTLEARH